MCLRISRDEENQKFIERLRKAGKRGLTVYKEFCPIDKQGYTNHNFCEIVALESPYRYHRTNLSRKNVKDIVIKSNRRNKNLNSEEKRIGIVERGIHVYTNKKRWNLTPIRVYYEDFVDVGFFDLSRSAVFMKVTLLKKDIKKILGVD